MSSLILTALVSVASVAAQQYLPTAAIANNAPQASAYSFLPFAGADSSIKGRFDFQSQMNGTTSVTFSLSDLASNLSYPLSYFISEQGVPTNGDCYLAGPVFDPAGALSYCNPSYPQACKVGDLSGKHMNVTQNSTGGDYFDNFISFSSQSTEYFASRAIVLMDSNSTRLACTNITLVSAGNGTGASNMTASPVTYANVYNVPESNNTSATGANSTTNGTSSGSTSTSGTSRTSSGASSSFSLTIGTLSAMGFAGILLLA